MQVARRYRAGNTCFRLKDKLNFVLTKRNYIDATENRESLSSHRVLNSQINCTLLSLDTFSHKCGLDDHTRLHSFITGELHPYRVEVMVIRC